MLLHTLEYQVPVLGNDRLYRVTFVDSGTVGCNAEVQEQRVSAGAGIRIVVPLLGPVPIALDFGFRRGFQQSARVDLVSCCHRMRLRVRTVVLDHCPNRAADNHSE